MSKQTPEIQTNRPNAGKVHRLLLAVTVAASIGGCASGIQEDPSGANAVTVKPWPDRQLRDIVLRDQSRDACRQRQL